MVRFAGFATIIKPTGYRGPSFTGGMAKGFMQSRYQDEQDQLKREEIAYKNEAVASNLAAAKSQAQARNTTRTLIPLISPANGKVHEIKGMYRELKGETGESEGSLAWRQLLDFEGQLEGENGQYLKASFEKNPDLFYTYWNDR